MCWNNIEENKLKNQHDKQMNWNIKITCKTYWKRQKIWRKQCCIHAKPQSHLERQATTIFTRSWRTRFLIGYLKMKLSYLTKNTQDSYKIVLERKYKTYTEDSQPSEKIQYWLTDQN